MGLSSGIPENLLPLLWRGSEMPFCECGSAIPFILANWAKLFIKKRVLFEPVPAVPEYWHIFTRHLERESDFFASNNTRMKNVSIYAERNDCSERVGVFFLWQNCTARFSCWKMNEATRVEFLHRRTAVREAGCYRLHHGSLIITWTPSSHTSRNISIHGRME